MKELLGTIGLLLLLAFILVACDPEGSGQKVRTFLDAAHGVE